MQIVIRRSGTDWDPTWSLIELQGELESSSPPGSDIGDLTLTQDGKATLVIGNHKLEGQFEELKKPLAVANFGEIDDNGRTVEIIGVITRKIHFKSRPQPLVHNLAIAG